MKQTIRIKKDTKGVITKLYNHRFIAGKSINRLAQFSRINLCKRYMAKVFAPILVNQLKSLLSTYTISNNEKKNILPQNPINRRKIEMLIYVN